MFSRISKDEHEAIVARHLSEHKATIVLLAEKGGISTEGKDVEAIVSSLTEKLEATVEMNKEITALNEEVEGFEKQVATLKEQASSAEKRAVDAEATVKAVETLFGQKALAEDFDVVEAVGSICPEDFTRSIQQEQEETQADASIETELDKYSAQFEKGQISRAEFVQKCEAFMQNN